MIRQRVTSTNRLRKPLTKQCFISDYCFVLCFTLLGLMGELFIYSSSNLQQCNLKESTAPQYFSIPQRTYLCGPKKWWGHLIADLKMVILSKNPRIRSTVLNWVNFPDFTEWILGKILHKLKINSNSKTINYSSKSSFRSWWSAAVAWPVLPGLFNVYCLSYKLFHRIYNRTR